MLIVSSYFAGVWALLAREHQLIGSTVVVLIGLGLGFLSFRGGSERASARAGAAISAGTPRPSLQAMIDAHSADPESPERRRARFLGALGHELRNPLNSITGFSDMLLSGAEGSLNDEQIRSVQTIRSSAERLLRLVTTVVDRARVEAGMLRLQQQWVPSSELVPEAKRFIESRLDDATVSGEVSEGLPRVFIDRQRTVQAVVSLAVLVIRSSGSGIAIRVAPPRRDQVGRSSVQFDLIALLEDASVDTLAIVECLEHPQSRPDALGLEVSVARSIIESQGGRIWAEAGTAGSLRVCMTLPTSAS